MGEKMFIQYGNKQPINFNKVKSFYRQDSNVIFLMDNGSLVWDFTSVGDVIYVMEMLTKKFVNKLELKPNKEAQDSLKKLDIGEKLE